MTDRIDSFEGEYRFLSNFWPDTGITNEHFYQAAKYDEPAWVNEVMVASGPLEAKRAGRAHPARSNWDNERVPVMLTLLRIKFTTFADAPMLAEKLLATGDAELVEGNWWHDTFWGVCTGKCKRGPHNPHGENHLGQLLMQVRAELR